MLNTAIHSYKLLYVWVVTVHENSSESIRQLHLLVCAHCTSKWKCIVHKKHFLSSKLAHIASYPGLNSLTAFFTAMEKLWVRPRSQHHVMHAIAYVRRKRKGMKWHWQKYTWQFIMTSSIFQSKEHQKSNLQTILPTLTWEWYSLTAMSNLMQLAWQNSSWHLVTCRLTRAA